MAAKRWTFRGSPRRTSSSSVWTANGCSCSLWPARRLSPEERRNPRYQQGSRQDLDADWQVRLPVKAGPREVQVAFLKKPSAAVETVRLPFLRPYAGAGGDTRYQPYLSMVTISGPFGVSSSGDTPSRDRLFVCRPVSPADAEESACAREILATLARRAYRRPVTHVDLEMLLAFYRDGRAEGGFDVGIQRALERLLVSPQFLLRIERDPAGIAADTNYPVSDLELASRLSFFLWSSLPDDELSTWPSEGRSTSRRSSSAKCGACWRMADHKRW